MKAVLFAVTFVFCVVQAHPGWAEGKMEPAPKAEAKPHKTGKADKTAKPGKGELTLKGEMMCGKCSLNETEDCQNVLKVEEGGKQTKYYLADNKMSLENHDQVCGGPAGATVVGKVKKVKGKNVLTASRIVYE